MTNKFFASSLMLMFLFFSCNSPEETSKEFGKERQRPANEPEKLMVSTSEQYGEYLSDGAGRALYLFEADSSGKSTCYDDCAKAWPPFITTGTPVLGDAVNNSMVGIIERKDGSRQVAYNGWPLYYYVKDSGPGDTKGHDIETHGAEWYLLAPDGKKIEGKHHH